MVNRSILNLLKIKIKSQLFIRSDIQLGRIVILK